MSTDYECPVCLSPYCLELGDVLYPHRVCAEGHRVCMGCVESIRDHGKQGCPVCRKPMNKVEPVDHMTRNLIRKMMEIENVEPSKPSPKKAAVSDHPPPFTTLGGFEESLPIPTPSSIFDRYLNTERQIVDAQRRNLALAQQQHLALESMLFGSAPVVRGIRFAPASPPTRRVCIACGGEGHYPSSISCPLNQPFSRPSESRDFSHEIVAEVVKKLCDGCALCYTERWSTGGTPAEALRAVLPQLCAYCKRVLDPLEGVPSKESVIPVAQTFDAPPAPHPKDTPRAFGHRELRDIIRVHVERYGTPEQVVAHDLKRAWTVGKDKRPAWCPSITPCRPCMNHLGGIGEGAPCENRPPWMRTDVNAARLEKRRAYWTRHEEVRLLRYETLEKYLAAIKKMYDESPKRILSAKKSIDTVTIYLSILSRSKDDPVDQHLDYDIEMERLEKIEKVGKYIQRLEDDHTPFHPNDILLGESNKKARA
jgi:hypothetical protein